MPEPGVLGVGVEDLSLGDGLGPGGVVGGGVELLGAESGGDEVEDGVVPVGEREENLLE